MADIKHRVGGEEYGTWTIPKKQIKEGYKAARGYEIDDDLLDDMSSIKYYSYTNKDTQEVEVRRVDGLEGDLDGTRKIVGKIIDLWNVVKKDE